MRRPLASRVAALALCYLVSGCALFHPEGLPPPAERQVGTASWYGAEFHGRRTASGARFDRQALTAAHPTLPLGSRVRVTNLDNERSVVVVVNDRGPFVGGRVIDVSQGAARRLGMVERGTTRVRVTRIDGAEAAAVSGDASAKPRGKARAVRRVKRVSRR